MKKLYLQRAIYDDLLNWKKKDSGNVLEINGARQVARPISWINLPKKIIKRIFISIWFSFQGNNLLRAWIA